MMCRPCWLMAHNCTEETRVVLGGFHFLHGIVNQRTYFVGIIETQELCGAGLFLVGKGILLVSKKLMKVGYQLQRLWVEGIAYCLLTDGRLARGPQVEFGVVLKKSIAWVEDNLKPSSIYAGSN